MAALTGAKQNIARQPSDLVPYTGASGYSYYSGGMLMKGATAGLILPVTTTGLTNSTFLGVNITNAFPANGASNATLEVFKTGEFTFDAQGTGISAHIGQIAYAFNDNTVGVSSAVPRLPVGEIVGIPTSTTYRVRITNYTGRVSE